MSNVDITQEEIEQASEVQLLAWVIQEELLKMVSKYPDAHQENLDRIEADLARRRASTN